MNFEEYFKEENIDILFEIARHDNEFIACANDKYSEFNSSDSYSRSWSWQFPAGRYVIIVYQRYAVYKDGVEVYINENFTEVVSKECRHKELRYSLITKNKNEFYIPSWKGNLVTHSVQNENSPLQNKYFSSVEDAREVAVKYSKKGNTVAIVSWYADYDMY